MIELLIVLAIAAILAAIAWPAYQSQVQRGRRSDAMSALAAISQAQERWRSDSSTYQSVMADLPGGMSVSQGGHYDVSMVDDTVSASGYSVQATAKTTSPQYQDTTCRSLQMTLAAGRINYTSRNSSDANSAPDPCWVR
jgi:type IV pilus assembly protein PilE